LGFFDDALMFQSSFYDERCGNQLLEMPLSGISGFTSVMINRDAELQNKGLEFDLRWTLKKSGNFQLSCNLNLGLNRNKVLSFPNLERTIYVNSVEVGRPIGSTQLFKFLGVDPQTGLYMVEDKDKNGQISEESIFRGGDKYWYNTYNKYSGGLGVDFSWKNIAVNFFLNYARRRIWNQ
jgi:hypothetical protein